MRRAPKHLAPALSSRAPFFWRNLHSYKHLALAWVALSQHLTPALSSRAPFSGAKDLAVACQAKNC